MTTNAKDAYVEKYLPNAGPLFACQECGKRFKTIAAAERAASEGCPKCGGGDIDLC
jgi:predicted nucleic acid-binding Zn ribbon protein